MKLVKSPEPGTSPKDRARLNVQAELYRLTTAVDTLKTQGTIEELDAAQRVLWGAVLIVDGLLGRER